MGVKKNIIKKVEKKVGVKIKSGVKKKGGLKKKWGKKIIKKVLSNSKNVQIQLKGNAFIFFKGNSFIFICDDKQTDRQTDRQTESIAYML